MVRGLQSTNAVIYVNKGRRKDSDRGCLGTDSSAGMRFQKRQSEVALQLVVGPRGRKSHPHRAVLKPYSGVEDDLREEGRTRGAGRCPLDTVFGHSLLLLSEGGEKQNIIDLIVEPFMDYDLNYGEGRSPSGSGFKWKKETLDRTWSCLWESGMDIKVMAASRLASLNGGRLSHRVEPPQGRITRREITRSM
jgi:hypothetical protein